VPVLTGAAPEGTAVTVVAPEAPPAGPAPSWIEAVRLERWADAAALIDALPEASRARPDMRYVRARAAVGSGDGARAVTLLDGLEAALPLLGPDVARWRAEAQLLAGPFAPAAAYFARSAKPRDLIRAAGAYEKAGDTASARSTADRAVAAAGHARHEEAAARM
jgi:soluble lytic murein transglycosylase